jgi:hypothetical protein
MIYSAYFYWKIQLGWEKLALQCVALPFYLCPHPLIISAEAYSLVVLMPPSL